jgi:hypothetical protein
VRKRGTPSVTVQPECTHTVKKMDIAVGIPSTSSDRKQMVGLSEPSAPGGVVMRMDLPQVSTLGSTAAHRASKSTSCCTSCSKRWT